jgi:hypothetical protein
MRVWVMAVGALVIGGCDQSESGPLDMTVLVPHNFRQITDDVLQPHCSRFAVCHSTAGAANAGKQDLSIDPYRALVNVPANNAQASAEGKVRVKPCDPDNSLLWIKLNLPVTQTDSKVGYGASMPKDGAHLAPEQLAAIHDWIARGAHEVEPDDVTGATCMTDDAAVQLDAATD